MKIQTILALGVIFGTVPAQADLASYQSTVNAQSPSYYFTFDNGSLVDSVGGASTLTVSGGPTATSDYFGNANDAMSFPASSDFLQGAAGIISGDGTETAVGSVSFLFYTPATLPSTGYYFSDGEETASGGGANQPGDSAFTVQFSGGSFDLKVGNKTTTLATPNPSTWYYMTITYDFDGVAADDTVNWYLGALGGTLTSGLGTQISASASTVGDGLGLVLGNKQAAITGTPTSTAGVAGGAIDEFATFDTVLTSDQVNAQFSALAVPEPSAGFLFCAGGLLMVWAGKLHRGRATAGAGK